MIHKNVSIVKLAQWHALWRPGGPVLLDVFCGAGGAAMGYWRAGFNVIGVDISPQPRFPFPFIQADALEAIRAFGADVDAIHASPPCQAYSRLRHLPWLRGRKYPELIEPVRDALRLSGKHYVIENVPGAPLHTSILLCGYSFGLKVYRHRLFETSFPVHAPVHKAHDITIGAGGNLNDRRGGDGNMIMVAGNQFRKEEAESAMGIYWMSKHELSQAIPPVYTEWIGAQLIGRLKSHNSLPFLPRTTGTIQLAMF